MLPVLVIYVKLPAKQIYEVKIRAHHWSSSSAFITKNIPRPQKTPTSFESGRHLKSYIGFDMVMRKKQGARISCLMEKAQAYENLLGVKLTLGEIPSEIRGYHSSWTLFAIRLPGLAILVWSKLLRHQIHLLFRNCKGLGVLLLGGR